MEPNGDVTNGTPVITKVTQALLRLVSRIMARPSTINCYIGRSKDLDLPSDPRDREGFSRAVKLYYREQQESG